MFPLAQRTIFLTLAGSQAHGSVRDGSDVKLHGICVARLSVRLSLFRAFQQYEFALPGLLAETIDPRIKGHPTASRAHDIQTECAVFGVANSWSSVRLRTPMP